MAGWKRLLGGALCSFRNRGIAGWGRLAVESRDADVARREREVSK